MAKQNSTKRPSPSLSDKGVTDTRSETPATPAVTPALPIKTSVKQSNGKSEGNWVTLRHASDETGISISTLRNWYRKGLVNSRIEKGPNGTQRLVELGEVRGRVPQKYAPERTTPGATASIGEVAVSKSLPDLIEELAQARERAGRAEARAELLMQQLTELRSQSGASDANHNTLHAENEMLRERFERLREEAEDMARRLSFIEDGEVIDLDADEIDVRPPPEENDEFLAMTQRWKARRKRRKFARREAKLSGH